MTKIKYFYTRKNGQVFGPFPAFRLKQMFQAGHLSDETDISPDKETWQNVYVFFTGHQRNTGRPEISLFQNQTGGGVPEDHGVRSEVGTEPEVQESQEAISSPCSPAESMPQGISEQWGNGSYVGPLCTVAAVFLVFLSAIGISLYLLKDDINSNFSETGNEIVAVAEETPEAVSSPSEDVGEPPKPPEAESPEAQNQPEGSGETQPDDKREGPEDGPAAGTSPAEEKQCPSTSDNAPQSDQKNSAAAAPQEAQENAAAAEPSAAEDPLAPAPSDETNPKEQSFSSVVKLYGNSVGVVVLSMKISSRPDLVEEPIGTAWAFAPRKFATNAHVAYSMPRIIQKFRSPCPCSPRVESAQIFIILSNSGKRQPVHSLQVISEDKQNRMDADQAILHTKSRVDKAFRLAAHDDLRKLTQAQEIGYLGFPMEGLLGGNLNIQKPVASFHAGTIVAISDEQNKDSGFARNTCIRHSLPAVGGASGSPIFTKDGRVIAILNAGNMDIQFDAYGNVKGRKPSAAMINFGIRIDCLRDCEKVPQISAEQFLGVRK